MSQVRTECTVKVCRICLRTNCRMYKFDQYNLLAYYMEIMGTRAKLPDSLPSFFCFECATLLHKAHKFKLKCNRGLTILKQLARRHPYLTYQAVQKVSRKKNKLKTLDILDVNDRVRTILLSEYHSENNLRKTLNSIKINNTLNAEKILQHVNVLNSESDIEEIKIKEENDLDMQFVDEDINTAILTVDVKTELLSNNLNVNCKDNDNFTLADIIIENSVASDENDADFRMSDVETESDDEILAKIQVKAENNGYKFEHNDCIENNKRISYEKHDKPRKKQKKHKTVKDSINNLKVPIKKRKLKKHKTEKDTELDQFGMKKSNPKFCTRKIKRLDPKLWKQYCLTEEQAWVEFNDLLNDYKYIAAEYKCTDCRMWFRRDDIMKRHMFMKHDQNGKLSCRFCHMRFKRDCVLRRHLRKHFTRFECQACDFKSSNESSVEFHQQMHSGQKQECKLCGEAFRHMSTYYTHLRTHRTNFICTLCGVSFVSEKGLYMHKKVKHCTQDDINDYEEDSTDTYCVKCEIRFETRKAYEEHMFQSANHHIADKPDETSTGIQDPGRKLKVGFVMTSGKGKGPRKPTTCHQCGQQFDTQSACMKHHKAQHPRTSFYPDTERHICEICGASISPNSIAAHLNTHQPQVLYTCDTCGRSFNTRVSLSRHILTHTGERPYPCKACDKRFGQRCTMVAHYNAIHLKIPYPKRNRRKKPPPPEVECSLHEGIYFSRGLMPLAQR